MSEKFNIPDTVGKRYMILLFDESRADEKERAQCDHLVQKIFESQPDTRTFWQFYASEIILYTAILTLMINWTISNIIHFFRSQTTEAEIIKDR